MPIRRPTGLYAILSDLVPRLDVAHGDLTRLAGLLSSAAVRVRNGPNPDPAAPGEEYNIAGWIAHFDGESQRLGALSTGYASRLTALGVSAPVQDYLAGIPGVLAAMRAAVQGVAAGELVPMPRRQALAAAITGALEG